MGKKNQTPHPRDCCFGNKCAPNSSIVALKSTQLGQYTQYFPERLPHLLHGGQGSPAVQCVH